MQMQETNIWGSFKHAQVLKCIVAFESCERLKLRGSTMEMQWSVLFHGVALVIAVEFAPKCIIGTNLQVANKLKLWKCI